MPTRLILIRHGETDWSCQKRYCGLGDIPLNKKGRKQAEEVSRKLKKEKINKVYSSDMKRTVQFARIVFKEMHIEKLPELREINFGIFEGLSYKDVLNRYPAVYKKWIENPLEFTIPEGEGLNDMAERTRRALAKILSHNRNKTAVTFTHAGPIKVMLCDILKRDISEAWQIEQDLGAVNIIEFTKKRGRIRLLNG